MMNENINRTNQDEKPGDDSAYCGRLDYLDLLESESIHIFREVAGQFERPALLFSGGKDSIVLVHLALKAFSRANSLFRCFTLIPGTILRRPWISGTIWSTGSVKS
jgi:3'-phosphoadenosine 5'-phosphosulfate sulfotransferase (PAPS reductase)/FAD synthetase